MKLRPLALITLLMVLVSLNCARSSINLTISVYTDNPWYNIEDDVKVYGTLSADTLPVENETVALEVRDPADSPVIVRTIQTNSSGAYSTVFKLTLESQLGTYTVHVSSNHNEVTATNTTSFDLGEQSLLTLTLETSSRSYNVEETIEVYGLITLGGQPVQGVLVAVEVQDPLSTPVIIRVLETDIDGAFLLTFQMPEGAITGAYTVHASASSEGHMATADTTFQLQPPQLSADLNGDGVVNILDIAIVALAWGSYPGHPRWNPICDIDGNNAVNIIDITIVAIAYNP